MNLTTFASVNLILFEPREIATPLPRADRRAIHLLEVLRRRPGDTFDAGMTDGPIGKGSVRAIEGDAITLDFTWHGEPPPLPPIELIVGLPRPQTARKILQESTALGITGLHFVRTDRAEPSYAGSILWSSGEYRRHLIAGAEQAFCTRLPRISHGQSLEEILATLPSSGTRIALDNYESTQPLGALNLSGEPTVLAIGGERGWSAGERDLLRTRNFLLAHLGRRVLRVETACVAALALVKARAGYE